MMKRPEDRQRLDARGEKIVRAVHREDRHDLSFESQAD
jgi:hypothetical protein